MGGNRPKPFCASLGAGHASGGLRISFHPTKSGRYCWRHLSNADKNTPSPCGLASALFFLHVFLRRGPHPKGVDGPNLMIPSMIRNRVWWRRWFARGRTGGSDHAARRRRRSLECLVNIAVEAMSQTTQAPDRGKFARIIILGKRRNVSGKPRWGFGLLQISTNDNGEAWVRIFR